MRAIVKQSTNKKVNVGMTKRAAQAAYQQYIGNGGDLTFADWLNTTQTGASLPALLKVRAEKRKKKRLVKRYANFVYADGTTDSAEVEEDLDEEGGFMPKLKALSDKQIAGFGLGSLVVGALVGVGFYHLFTKNN